MKQPGHSRLAGKQTGQNLPNPASRAGQFAHPDHDACGNPESGAWKIHETPDEKQRRLAGVARTVGRLDPGGVIAAIGRASRDAVVFINAEGTVLSFNAMAADMFGCPEDLIAGHNIRLLMPGPEAGLHDTHLDSYVHGGPGHVIGKGRVVTAMRRDGTLFPARLTVERVVPAGQNPGQPGMSGPKTSGPETSGPETSGPDMIFCGVMQDLSQELARDSKSSTRQEQLAAVLLAVGEAILSVSSEGLIELANPAAEQILADGRHSLTGSHLGNYLSRICLLSPWFQPIPVPERESGQKASLRAGTSARPEETLETDSDESVLYQASLSSESDDASLEDDRTRLMNVLLGALARTPEEAVSFSARAIRSDGRQFPVVMTVCARILDGRRHLVVVLRDETERQQYEDRLAEAFQASEAASRAKTRFLNHMSHELRTPLNAVIGFSDVMRQERLGTFSRPVYRDYADNIHSCGRHLLGIVEDVLDLTRLEREEVDLDLQSVDLEAFCQETKAGLAPQAEEKAVRIDLVCHQAAPLRADPLLLGRILRHCLLNAIRFNPPHTVIEVRWEESPEGGCEIRISDNGRGIAPEILETALDPFHDQDSGTTITGRGAGLGLPVSSRFMLLHGGRLKIFSKRGEGTCVLLQFPPAPKILEKP